MQNTRIIKYKIAIVSIISLSFMLQTQVSEINRKMSQHELCNITPKTYNLEAFTLKLFLVIGGMVQTAIVSQYDITLANSIKNRQQCPLDIVNIRRSSILYK